MLRKLLLAVVAAFSLFAGDAQAQTAPNWYTGKVPTAGEWAQAWGSKQDYLGAAPCLVTGCVMQGRLVTVAPSTRSGLNLTPGTGAPSSPFDGDVWVTSAGMFVRVNGTTVGPLSASAGGGVCTNQVVVSLTSGVPGCASITNAMLAAGNFSSITGVGTLTAGATGAGFTIALSTSTVTGNLGVTHLNNGTGASSSTFWRGDNTWAVPSGSGTVTSAQLTQGPGINIAVTSGANPCTTTCNLTISQFNSMGSGKVIVQATAGGSGTLPTPTGAAWAMFTMIGGGGSGSGGGTVCAGGPTACDGISGGATCISLSGAACTSPVWQAAGGTGGSYSGSTGGTSAGCSGSGTFILQSSGGDGAPPTKNWGTTQSVAGAPGGGAPGYGVGGASAGPTAAGAAGKGIGGGGQGGAGSGAVASNFGGAGGAGGSVCTAFVQSPASSYTYANGTGAVGGTAGTNGQAGGQSTGGGVIAVYGFN